MAQRAKQLPRQHVPSDPGKEAKGQKKHRRETTLLLLCTVLVPILAILVRSKFFLSDSANLPSTATTVVSETTVPADDRAVNSTKPIYRDADTDSPFHAVKLMLASYSSNKEVDTLPTNNAVDSIGIIGNHNIDERDYEGSAGTGEEEEEEQFLLGQWDSPDPKLRRLSRCKLLVSNIYKQNMNWTNTVALQYHNVSFAESWNRTMSKASTLMVERLRIYNYCFLDGILGEGLNTEEVFGAKFFQSRQLDEWDFQCRMFPFLKCNTDIDNKMLWPEVYNLTFQGNVSEEQKFRFGSDPKPSLPSGTTLRSFNVNFMRNWARYSKGKGIVTTMNLKHIPFFGRHLRVLDKLGNKLPIQVIIVPKEFDTNLFGNIFMMSHPTQQQVSVVDLRGVLDEKFVEECEDPFLFKWFAALFNTFEEELLIDADTVLFEPTTSYFDISEYKRTGIYMYRDRSLPVNHTAKCSDYMFRLEPSQEEVELFGTRLQYDRNYVLKNETTDVGGIVYTRFMMDYQHNNLESGVVVLHKRKKLGGLLVGSLINFVPVLNQCGYGDKEFFWLGQLYAGESYAINPYAGGALGTLDYASDEKRGIHQYKACSVQIAHLNSQGKLSWVNGGLQRCKVFPCGKRDLEKRPDYFMPELSTAEQVMRYYQGALPIKGLAIPYRSWWINGIECCMYQTCAIVNEGGRGSQNLGEGVVVKFTPEEIRIYNEIAQLWSQDF